MLPQAVTLLPYGTQEFVENGVHNWRITPSLGSVTQKGLYKAPKLVWLSRTVSVVAEDSAGNEISRAIVTLSSALSWMSILAAFWVVTSTALFLSIHFVWPPPASSPAIQVFPQVVTLKKGDSLQFLSSTTGVGGKTVNWAANHDAEILPSGVFTAPAAGPAVVTATRTSDHAQTASATVIVADRQLVMSRSVVDATAAKNGDRINLSVTSSGNTEQSLNWYLSGPGELDRKTGVYTVRDRGASEAIVTVVDPESNRRAATVVLLNSDSTMGDEAMLRLVAIMGALGAMLGAVRSFVNYVGNRAFQPSWGFYYIFWPMFGSGLALIVFFGYRIGAVTPTGNWSPADPFVAAFVAGMVGLFADIFLQKLKELVDTLFRPRDVRADKLPTAEVKPTITRLSTSNGILTIEGTGFISGSTVTLNGAKAQVTFSDASKVSVPVPAGAGVGTIVEVILITPDNAPSNTMRITL